MRTYVKQRRYQMHVREQILAETTNNAESGVWVTADKDCSKSQFDCSLHGCRGSEPGVGRPEKGGRVHWTRSDVEDRLWPILERELRGKIIGEGYTFPERGPTARCLRRREKREKNG